MTDARRHGSGVALGTALFVLFVAWVLFGYAAHAQGWTSGQHGSSYQPEGTTADTEFQSPDRQIKHCMMFRLNDDSSAVHTGCQSYQLEGTTTYTEIQGPDGQIKHCMVFRLNVSSAVHTDCQ